MKIFSFLVLLVFVSCDHSDDYLEKTIVEVEVGTNEELRHPLGNRPVEGGYSITKQPRSYISSEIKADEISGGLVYVYFPQNDFRGLEVVEITLTTSPGNTDFSKSLIVLRITVE